jgi:hypothetical protein
VCKQNEGILESARSQQDVSNIRTSDIGSVTLSGHGKLLEAGLVQA